MGIIHVSRFMSSGLSTELGAVDNIEIDDNAFAEGSFGKVYHCRKINGLPPIVPQVIKIFSDHGPVGAAGGYDTIVSLQEEIIARNTFLKHRNERSIEQVPALYALPQFSFQGSLNGDPVAGYSANYLGKDYLLFSALFEEGDQETQLSRRKFFYGQPLHVRLKMAYDLVEGFRMLESLSFIYADLNPRNFFVNVKAPSLCLIDYDSGAVIKTAGDHATTFGKKGDWLAPEIQDQLISNTTGNIIVDMHTDTWAVAIGLHYLLFPLHPLAFLGVLGKQQAQYYFSKYKWPQVDKQDTRFCPQRMKMHERYLKTLYAEIPPEIIQGFEATINDGYYTRGMRLSYAQWLNRLAKLMGSPVIGDFKADLTHVVPGVAVTFTWKVDRAHTLMIDNGVGNVTGKNAITVQPEKNQIYTLTAIGYFNTVTGPPCRITIIPPPAIETLKVPIPDTDIGFSSDLSQCFPPVSDLRIDIPTVTLPDLSGICTAASEFVSAQPPALPDTSSIFDVSGIINYIKEKINNL